LDFRFITAKEADDVIETWAKQSLRICFAVCFGDLAWHTRWVGPIHGGDAGRWVQTVDDTTNVLCTDQYEEIILVDDVDLLGLRFRNPKGFATANFEVMVFTHKSGNIDNLSASLLNRMIR
jgi:hypothetical protein